MNKISKVTTLSFLVVSMAAGCSSSFSSGVSGDSSLKDLSEDEKTTFCESFRDYSDEFAEDNKEALCKFTGVTTAAFSAAFDPMADATMICEATVMECTSATAMVDGDPVASCKAQFTADCNVTVQEFEDCINADFEAREEAFAEFSKSCSELLNDSGSSMMTTSSTIAACQVVAEKCPTAGFGL